MFKKNNKPDAWKVATDTLVLAVWHSPFGNLYEIGNKDTSVYGWSYEGS